MRIAILIKDSFAPYLRPFLTARICGVGLKCETINMRIVGDRRGEISRDAAFTEYTFETW